MIDAVAKALARWAVPVNDWDALAEEQRERWRDAARVAVDAIRSDMKESLPATLFKFFNHELGEFGEGMDSQPPCSFADDIETLTIGVDGYLDCKTLAKQIEVHCLTPR